MGCEVRNLHPTYFLKESINFKGVYMKFISFFVKMAIFGHISLFIVLIIDNYFDLSKLTSDTILIILYATLVFKFRMFIGGEILKDKKEKG